MYVPVSSSKAQFKIQEMAFVLVALMMLFALVAVIYINVRTSSFHTDVEEQREEEARLLVRKMATTPEFAWLSTTCAHCIDTDKLLILREHAKYKEFWDLDYLAIEWVSPNHQGECTRSTYPQCGTITIINRTIGTPVSTYVALCRHEANAQASMQCDLGKISASGRSLLSNG